MSGHAGLISRARKRVAAIIPPGSPGAFFGQRFFGVRYFGNRYFK